MSSFLTRHLQSRYLWLVILSPFIMGCFHGKPVKIALSKATPNYIRWLKHADSSLILVDLYPLSRDTALFLLGECSGLLLTGGEDIYPGWYGKESDTGRCTEMNPHRDSLEMALITKAMEIKMPVLGVCRGQQILNVYLRGKLIIDIPADFKPARIHQCEDYLHCFHTVFITKNTLLHKIAGCDSGSVTTNHHQAVEILSPLLTANARSADGLIEGIEWRNPAGKSFLLGVQWHPERMEKSNGLSGHIADEFIRQAALYASWHYK